MTDTIDAYIDKKYIKVHGTWEACEEELGEPPVLSKIGCISKVKNGKLKHRIIIDAKKESKASKASKLPFRVQLPRVLAAIFDTLERMSCLKPHADIMYFVLDLVNAF